MTTDTLFLERLRHSSAPSDKIKYLRLSIFVGSLSAFLSAFVTHEDAQITEDAQANTEDAQPKMLNWTSSHNNNNNNNLLLLLLLKYTKVANS